MKKVLLALTTFVGFAAYAQQALPNGAVSPDLKVDEAEVQQIEQLIQAKKANAKKMKTAGGVINNALIGWTDTIYGLNGGSSIFNIYQNPIWQDSLAKEEFSNAVNFISAHGIGTTYDPTSPFWGATQFSSADDYTVDSVYILGAYRTPAAISNPSGDSLIVEFTWAPATSTGTWHAAGTYFPGSTPGDTCRYISPNITVSGVPANPKFKLAGANRIRTGIELTANDTISSGSQLYGVEINQLIPAGNLVAYTFYFKSAYKSQLSTGDTVFSTVTPQTVAAPNFAGRLAQDANVSLSNLELYFCDPIGDNITSTINSGDLYVAGAGWASPETYNGNFTYLMVSGTSTVGLDEEVVNNNVELYPNPTSGVVNIAISQGGTYNVEVVNMLGQVVHAEQVTVSGNEKLTRNFSGLTKGIYLVSIKGDNYSNTSKLTINK